MIKWFKQLFKIVRNYDADKIFTTNRIADVRLEALKKITELDRRMEHAEREVRDGVRCIKDRTEIHADVSPSHHDPHQVVMIGRYKNREYVRTFSVAGEDFEYFIQILTDKQRYARRGHIDAVQDMEYIIDTKGHDTWGI